MVDTAKINEGPSMIIKDLHIDGFGIFHDFTIRDLDQGLHLIVGKNEAGKSTLLSFIRYTLFGYPRTRDERYPPLAGGSHGGRISMLTREGKRILLERSGNNNKIKFIMDGVSSEDESGWLKCVDYASAELFRRIYAITIDELRGMESLTISGVEDKMFSLAMGLSGVSLRDIVTDLEQQSRQIYAPRSRKNEVSGLLAELNEIEKIENEMLKETKNKDKEKGKIEFGGSSCAGQVEALQQYRLSGGIENTFQQQVHQ